MSNTIVLINGDKFVVDKISYEEAYARYMGADPPDPASVSEWVEICGVCIEPDVMESELESLFDGIDLKTKGFE